MEMLNVLFLSFLPRSDASVRILHPSRMTQKLEPKQTPKLTATLSTDPTKCQAETGTLSSWYLQLGGATMTRPAAGTKVLESEEPSPVLTQLPLAGTHGLHHPDGQGRLQHGDPHVSKADGPFKGARG